MQHLVYSTIFLSIVILIMNAYLFYKYSIIPKTFWDKDLFNKDKRKYIEQYLHQHKTDPQLIKRVVYYFEVTSFLENNTVINRDMLLNYFSKNNFTTSTDYLIKRYAHLLQKQNNDNELNLNPILEKIFVKSNETLSKIESYDETTESENNIMLDSFLHYFLFFDLIEVLQNKNWSKSESATGLRYLLDNNIEHSTYAGSENLLKYKRAVINSYKILKKNNALPSSHLILGYKFIKPEA